MTQGAYLVAVVVVAHSGESGYLGLNLINFLTQFSGERFKLAEIGTGAFLTAFTFLAMGALQVMAFWRMNF